MLISQLHAAGVTGLCQHSNRIVAGDAFVAYPGRDKDGRNYIADAVHHGAQAVIYDPDNITASQETVLAHLTIPAFPIHHLADKIPSMADSFYQHPSEHLHIVAVTGTNGKSTIAYGMNQMYRALDVPVAMIGTLGIGTIDDCAPNPLTTPDPISLQRHLAEMYQEGIETVVMEASSHALHQRRLSTTSIRVAVFTNLTPDHLDYHQTMEAYGEAKAMLYQMSSVETVVINLDDPWCYAQLAHIPREKKVIGYTCAGQTHPRCDACLSAEKIGEVYQVSEGDVAVSFSPKLIGGFNISNLLAMIGAMRVDGFALHLLVQVAEQVSGIPGRLECVSLPDEPRVIVDFAHTPDALTKALEVIRPTVRGKLWCVFGCGGGRDTAKRPLMGEIATRFADYVIITTDNARDEAPQTIAAMIVAGMPHHARPKIILDREEAIKGAVNQASSEDTILIAGKGHEMTQTIGGIVMPFSDQETARIALRERRGSA